MEMIGNLIDWLFGLAGHYPVLFALPVGGVFGMTCTVALERYYLPLAPDPTALRHQKGATFLFCWSVSALAGIALWWAWAPPTPWPSRMIVSAVFGVLVFFGYPPIVSWLCVRFPSIGSAWNSANAP